jgi:hypothetical protein
MAEPTSKVDQVISGAEKPTAQKANLYETAIAEVGKLQSKGIAQGALLVQHMARGAQEQIAAAQRRGGEWRNLVRAATRRATGILGPKE